MPTVPVEQITTQLRPLDDTPLQAANFAAGSEQVAQAAAQVGQSVQQYADADYQRGQVVAVAGAKQIDAQVAQSQVGVLYGDDQNPGYTSLRGANALTGRADAEAALQKNATDALGQIDDPLTKRLATKVVQARLVDGMATIAKHYNEQQLEYGREQSSGRISDLSNQAVLVASDPDQFGSLVGAIKTEVHSQAQAEGLPIAKELQNIQAATDGVYRGVVEHMALTDPLAAQHYLDLHRDVVSAPTQQILDTQLRAHVADAQATQAALGVAGMGPAPQIGPTTTAPKRDALVQGTVAVESAGRNGLVSPKGAMGTMQMMPATAKAVCAQLGIPYDEDRLRNDPAYCNQIGRAYQDSLLSHYGGNATLATAAYNAGPSVVDDWINGTNRSGKNTSLTRLGDPRTGEIADSAWAAKIPFAETRDYVPKVLNATARAAGVVPQSLAQPAQTVDLAAGTETIRSQNLPPDVEEKAIAKLHQIYNDQQSAITQTQKQAYESVLPAITSGRATALTDIDPKAFSAMSPEQQRTIVAALDHNAKGTDPQPNNPLYLSAIRAAATNPAVFANTDLTPLWGKIPKADWDNLQKRQADIITGGATSPKAVAYRAIDKIVSDLAPSAGLVLDKPKAGIPTAPDSPTGAPMANRIRDMHDGIQADVDTFHAQNGKWPTLEQVQAMGARRMTQVTLPGTGGWFSNDKTALLGELPPNTRYTLDGSNVPALARSQITSAFIAQYHRPPTLGEIATIYTRAH